jgi:trk system potassium uptake protein TrkH
VEAIGAFLLFPVFGSRFGVLKGLGMAAFHSVSAFCNAGFDLMGETGAFSSLTSLSQHHWTNAVIILLITIGGIGFLTWDDVRQHGFRFRRYRMQSKIILVTSAALVLIPFLYFLFYEFQDLPFGHRIWPALFQSVTLRTAGFNTVDLTKISGSGQALMIFWMLVGGSPGSTAGGMKTTTLAILILAARSVLMRREHVECFGRRIEDVSVRHAVAIVLLYFILALTAAMVISQIDGLPLLTCLFETASAAGTVGLTLGITGSLGTVSRILIILLMFFGRVGGLTLIYAMQSPVRGGQGALPVEKITVG